MSILLLGAHGQLGRDLFPLLQTLGPVQPLTREQVDLTDASSLRDMLVRAAPRLVVNCAAYNLVDRAESEPEAAFRVNAWAIRDLAHICRDLSACLVHFSTDYVFGLDSDTRTPLRPTDCPGPVSVYGAGKLTGEYFIRSLCPEHLIVRTCGLYGLHGVGGKGTNFVETMLRLAQQGRPLRIVHDQICAPSSTADVAETTLHLLRAGVRGLWHVVNPGGCSWFDFAQAIFALENMHPEVSPISSAEFGAAAQRPAYSVLDVSDLTSVGIPLPRPWRDALRDYLQRRRLRHTN